MKEFTQLMFDGMSITQFMVFLVLAVGGLMLNIVVDILRRRPCSLSSPKKLSISYWFHDNWKRLLLSLALLPLAVLLFKEITGGELNRLNAFYAGFSADALAELLKRRSFIGSASIK